MWQYNLCEIFILDDKKQSNIFLNMFILNKKY